MSKADQIVDVLIEVLEENGLKLNDIHLINYDDWRAIERDMEYRLRSEGLDLSYTSDYSEKYGLKLSGNPEGIIWSFWLFFKSKSKYGWQETEITGDMIENANGYYEEDRYGYARKISKERFISLVQNSKSGSRHMGIGSQASIIDTRIKLYADDKNNLLYDKSVLVYD